MEAFYGFFSVVFFMFEEVVTPPLLTIKQFTPKTTEVTLHPFLHRHSGKLIMSGFSFLVELSL